MLRSVAAFALFIAITGTSCGRAADLADLCRLLKEANDLWPEGVMECQVAASGPDSLMKVKAYWKNDMYRFEYEPVVQREREAGKPALHSGWVLIGRGQGFRYMKDSGTAVHCWAQDARGIEPSLQVLPNMAWLTFHSGHHPRISYLKWVKAAAPRFKHAVDRTEEGSYRLILSDAGGEAVKLEFNSLGLPTRFQQRHRVGEKAIVFSEHAWSASQDGRPSQPRKLTQKIISEDGQETISLEINVTYYRDKVGPDGPSFAIPPADLPAGIPIADLR